MKKTVAALFAALFCATGTAHAIPALFEWHTLSQSGYDAPDVNLSAFDMTTGLGTVTMTFTGAGSYSGGLYVDHELNEGTNTFFNEYGGVVGSAPGGLTWQIDEPGFGSAYTGTVYGNFFSNALTNSIFDGTFNGPEDVAMAMISGFDLGIDQTATLSFMISSTAPGTSFYLLQADGDYVAGSVETIYFSSSLDIRSPGPEPIPEPSTALLLGAGLLGLGGYMRKKRRS